MATTSLQVVIDSQARLDGFTKASQAVNTLQSSVARNQQTITQQMERQAKAQAQIVRHAKEQQSVFAQMARGFRGAVGMPTPGTSGGSGSMGQTAMLGMMAGAAGGWVGMAAGGIVAGLAYTVANAFRDVTLKGIQLADMLGDLSEQLGIERTEMIRLRMGASSAGVSQKTAIRSLSSLGALRGLALAGDPEATSLFSTYGVSRGMLESASSNLSLAQSVFRALGDAGAQAQDDAGLRRMFGTQYRGALAAIAKMPEISPVDEATLRQADRVASAKEYADLMQEVSSLKAAAEPGRVGPVVAHDSATVYYGNVISALKRMDDAVKSIGPRRAGFWTPSRLEPKPDEPENLEKPERLKLRREAAFDLNAESVGTPGSRRGLFASAADWRLWTSQLSVSKQQLDELKAIRAALSGGLQVDI